MIRDRVKQLKLNSMIFIEGLSQDLEFDMRDLFISEHFIKLKCDIQRRLWGYCLSAEKIIRTLMNDESSDEDMSSS